MEHTSHRRNEQGSLTRRAGMALLMAGTVLVASTDFDTHWHGNHSGSTSVAAEGSANEVPAVFEGSLPLPRLSEVVSALLGMLLESAETSGSRDALFPAREDSTLAASSPRPDR